MQLAPAGFLEPPKILMAQLHKVIGAALAVVAGAAAFQQLTAGADRQRMMDLLHIQSLRPGADGKNLQAPSAVNYDEAKVNPHPNLPDPLLLKNGKRVTSAKMWWDQRRPEIVEDFDQEIYGRVPADAPK